MVSGVSRKLDVSHTVTWQNFLDILIGEVRLVSDVPIEICQPSKTVRVFDNANRINAIPLSVVRQLPSQNLGIIASRKRRHLGSFWAIPNVHIALPRALRASLPLAARALRCCDFQDHVMCSGIVREYRPEEGTLWIQI